MDMQDFATFLENFNLILAGISDLVKATQEDRGTPYLWSPLSPDTIVAGRLETVLNEVIIEKNNSIAVYALSMLTENYPVLCLVYDDLGDYYILQVGK